MCHVNTINGHYLFQNRWLYTFGKQRTGNSTNDQGFSRRYFIWTEVIRKRFRNSQWKNMHQETLPKIQNRRTNKYWIFKKNHFRILILNKKRLDINRRKSINHKWNNGTFEEIWFNLFLNCNWKLEIWILS